MMENPKKKQTWQRLWLMSNGEFLSLAFVITEDNYKVPLAWDIAVDCEHLIMTESFPVLESLLSITDFHQWLQRCCLFLVIPSRCNLHPSLHFSVHWETWSLWTASVGPWLLLALGIFGQRHTFAGEGRNGKRKDRVFFLYALSFLSGQEVGVFLLWESSPTLDRSFWFNYNSLGWPLHTQRWS